MIVVLVVAAGAAWESRALTVLADDPRTVVLKRCVDVDDLLAAATAGEAEAAVVGIDVAGLDVAAVDHLRRHGVRPVAVVPAYRHEAAATRAARIGVTAVLTDGDLDELPALVATPPSESTLAGAGAAEGLPDGDDLAAAAPPSGRGRAVAVWGPAGAPGRSTVAAAIAADVARRGRRAVLLDADPYGGTIAQQLGVLDEVSGLLAAARLVAAGQVEERAGSVQRAVDPRLSVVTGLPRPDRWVEVREGTIDRLVDALRRYGDVVVDTGFSLEDDAARDPLGGGGRPARNSLTLAALDVADEAVVVGLADPIGLSRLARGLVELRERAPGLPVRVVVNRMRPSLGWTEKEIAGMLAGFARIDGLHFLPDDRAAVDRALVAGRTLAESGESALARAVAGLVDAMTGLPGSPPRRRGRRRP